MSLQSIKITNLQSDPRSANVMADDLFTKLVNNIKRSNQIVPLIVRPNASDKKEYIIVDGHMRAKAAKALEIESVLCVVWDIDDKEAALLLATLNKLRGEDHPKKRAELLQELSSWLEPDEMAELLPESEQDIRAIISQLQQEDADLEELIRREVEKEQAEVPTILQFILMQGEADFVNQTLLKLNENKNEALVMLCKEGTLE